jgi:hypothetical protein
MKKLIIAILITSTIASQAVHAMADDLVNRVSNLESQFNELLKKSQEQTEAINKASDVLLRLETKIKPDEFSEAKSAQQPITN